MIPKPQEPRNYSHILEFTKIAPVPHPEHHYRPNRTRDQGQDSPAKKQDPRRSRAGAQEHSPQHGREDAESKLSQEVREIEE
jgi:hypothetical protein